MCVRGICVNQPILLGETSCIIEARNKHSEGTNKGGKENERKIFPEWQEGKKRERSRERQEKMNLRMSSYFSVLSPHFLPGGRLCCSMCCSCSSGSSSSVSCSGIVVVVLVWVWTGKSVPTLIRWLIRLPVRQASTALRGCLSEVRVQASAAIQLFIVLTWAWGFSGWPRTCFK